MHPNHNNHKSTLPKYDQFISNNQLSNQNTKQIKILQSLDSIKTNRTKKYSITQPNQFTFRPTRQNYIFNVNHKKMSQPIIKIGQNKRTKQKFHQAQNPQTINNHNQNSQSSSIQFVQKDKKKLPLIYPIKLKTNQQKNFLSNIMPVTYQSRRQKTEPNQICSERKNIARLFFNKVEGAQNGNLLEFSRLKPTEQYFSKLKNVRLAERLLLMEPSREVRKSQHQKFYQQHKAMREHLSHSTLIKKKIILNKLKNKDKCSKCSKQQWKN